MPDAIDLMIGQQDKAVEVRRGQVSGHSTTPLSLQLVTYVSLQVIPRR
jgi:hypothetical protein